ncbi:MAG: transposase [Candidatus Shapirobacteria bacterium]|jgi:REP element-mobilizing transposase RayT
MSRLPRTNRIGLYHVINRGVEKRLIFLDDPDRLRFLTLVDEQKAAFDFNVVAYCLMPNHYHLLLEMKAENLSFALKRLDQDYTQYFNRKYNRVGSLWQGRFKSWFVYDEKYLRVLIQYIERNPIKKGITSRIGEYRWASSVTENPALSQNEIAQLTEFYSTKFLPQAEAAEAAMRESLPQHFLIANLARKRDGTKRAARDEAIESALRDGYSQSQIARYLGLTPAAISKRIKLKFGV